ncbi:restriction endonuclease [Nonomuraea angiospora]|uniref:restriction endonuclease n=1 Tax=Nonomuraea angiospora TaxID=46172 RepID=UPI0029A3B330|nr:restriction endonuclease [Nonomuraea angiospora]MDX3101623.1 restriction endonuclease [Nonomuraea angiospora]
MKGARRNSPSWRTYEEQVAQLLAAFDVEAEVIHNKRIEAKLSKVVRQVDVWARGTIIGQEIVIAVECKLKSRPLEIGAVDEFVGKLLDLGVDRGVLYSASGLTPNAVYRASAASNPSVIPVSLMPAPGPRGVPGLPIGYEDPDYADWLNREIYRSIITSKQWLPHYVRSEFWEKDERWNGVTLPEEREMSGDE